MESETGSLELARQKFEDGEYSTAIEIAESLLPSENNPRITSQIQLVIGQSYRALGDLKLAISAANSAIVADSKWKDPYVFRSSCFKDFHLYLQNRDGASEASISKDREDADIIVDQNANIKSEEIEEDDDKEKLRLLFRKQEKRKVVVKSIGEALRLVENGGKIFVEKGVYEVTSKDAESPYFLYGKRVHMYGASSSKCVLKYKCNRDLVSDLEPHSKLETFLIASNSKLPTVIKRFRFVNENPEEVTTKFLGLAGGTLQLEDCIFDGSLSPRVDAVYTNSKICGSFSSSYPTPYLIVRYCVFDHCSGESGITGVSSCININSAIFTGGSTCSVSAQASSKVTIENCEIEDSSNYCSLRSSSSDLTVSGSYIYRSQAQSDDIEEEGMCVLTDSVAKLNNNYISRVGTGVISAGTDLTCSRNLFHSTPAQGSVLHSAVVTRGGGRVLISENIIRNCDIGVHVTQQSNPSIRGNVFDWCFWSGVCADGGGRPIIAENTFSGGYNRQMSLTNGNGASVNENRNLQLSTNENIVSSLEGLGVLYISNSAGMLGKNTFQDYTVSPILVFTNCHPLLKDNSFYNVEGVEEDQANLERRLIQYFQTEVEVDSLFYLVDSQEKETALAPVILNKKT